MGTYDNEVAFAQKRALVIRMKIVYPDASQLELEGMPGADPAGYAGFVWADGDVRVFGVRVSFVDPLHEWFPVAQDDGGSIEHVAGGPNPYTTSKGPARTKGSADEPGSKPLGGLRPRRSTRSSHDGSGRQGDLAAPNVARTGSGLRAARDCVL